MLELYQAEWCPHSHKVRQRLTELGQPFIARQVAAEPEDREEMRAAVRSDTIPVLVLEDGEVLAMEADEIIAELDHRYRERPDAQQHRAHGAMARYEEPDPAS
jgi:glutathione S-transferase